MFRHARDQAHAGNGPEDPSSSRERTADDVFKEDVVPATSVLKDALRNCAALIGNSADTARDPDHTPKAQTEAALAAARLGATAAQLMGAIARAAITTKTASTTRNWRTIDEIEAPIF